MFPLGTVLVPGMVLPLHVFEPRYRRLVRDCLAGDREFGVVLIRRGSEVGGGDERTDVGTMATIVRADELPDGRWVVVAVGARRIRVERWLEDDPHPRAEVADWPDEPPAGGAPGEMLRAIEGLLRRSAALRTELGEPAPRLDLALDDDPVAASYQAVVAAPLGPADRQALLEAASVEERLRTLHRELREVVDVLEARLAHG